MPNETQGDYSSGAYRAHVTGPGLSPAKGGNEWLKTVKQPHRGNRRTIAD